MSDDVKMQSKEPNEEENLDKAEEEEGDSSIDLHVQASGPIYGGCEGPNAMYVKLVSSDGHEFIVKRDHALTSGTIKAMLSGPGQFAENEANEVNFREIPFMNPSENMYAAIATGGEGWHNYHHVFPWDYKAAEIGNFKFNFTTGFIDFFAMIGWAYDLKVVPRELVQRKVERTGDCSHGVRGWGNADQTQEGRAQTVVMHSLKKD